MGIHPPTVAQHAGNFEANLNAPGKVHQALFSTSVRNKDLMKGWSQKAMFPSPSGNTLIKPFHDEEEEKHVGLKEMMSQAMYHAGGIGHLHQRVSIHEHKGADGQLRPATVVHMHSGIDNYDDLNDTTLPLTQQTQNSRRLTSIRNDPSKKFALKQMLLMDLFTGNQDRNGGNFGFQQDNTPLAMDHGRAFYPSETLVPNHNGIVHLLPPRDNWKDHLTKDPQLKRWWNTGKQNMMQAANDIVAKLPKDLQVHYGNIVQNNYKHVENLMNPVAETP
jgi:hypothetical protein